MTYYGCIVNGSLTKVGTARPTCAKASQLATWNQTGPQGPAGRDANSVSGIGPGDLECSRGGISYVAPGGGTYKACATPARQPSTLIAFPFTLNPSTDAQGSAFSDLVTPAISVTPGWNVVHIAAYPTPNYPQSGTSCLVEIHPGSGWLGQEYPPSGSTVYSDGTVIYFGDSPSASPLTFSATVHGFLPGQTPQCTAVVFIEPISPPNPG